MGKHQEKVFAIQNKIRSYLNAAEIITASATENADLFSGTDSSYGSLGIMTSVSISLVQAHKYVELTYYPVVNVEELVTRLDKFDKANEEYLDAIMFSRNRGVIMVGKGVDACKNPLSTFLKAFDPWFAQHADNISKKDLRYTEYIPITDYIFRYDRGAYWMGDFFFEYTHLPNIGFLRGVLNPMFDTRTLFLGLQKGRLAKEFFIQDICFPIENTKNFLEFLDESLGIYPLWICPLKPAKKEEFLCSHCQSTELVLNVGIWGRTDKYLSNPVQKTET